MAETSAQRGAMLVPTTMTAIQAQIAWRLDCAPADLDRPGSLVKAHGPRWADYHGIYIWQMGAAVVITAPSDWVEAVHAAVNDQPGAAMVDPAFWHARLGNHVDRIIGPAYQGYVDTQAFQPAPPPEEPGVVVRRLAPADLPALDSFQAACPPHEWQDSAIAPAHAPIYVAERDGRLLAAASAPDDGPGLVSVGVTTSPAARGKGYGRAVVSALTANRLATGMIVHYQTLRANLPSIAIAHSLGFTDLATSLAIRLK